MSSRHFVIIGNGISGITFARHLRKGDSQLRITVISGESPYFFSRTALMYVYMGQMKWEHTQPYEPHFWEKNRIDLLQAWVRTLDFDTKTLVFESGDTLNYDILVLATGSKPVFFGWPGQQLKGVQGLYTKQDLELMESSTSKGVQRAVIVGGGLIGIEMVEMLTYKKIPVTFLVRESRFWEQVLPQQEASLIQKHIREQSIDLRLQTELKEILADEQGSVRAVVTTAGEEIACSFVGIATGVSPNVGFLKNTALAIAKGIKVNTYFESSEPDVYAIGDCAEFAQSPGAGRRTLEQVWYTGRMHGETLAHNFCQQPVPYQPGVWFNSAKFFAIEFQTYGLVSPEPSEEIVYFHWEHRLGRVSFRMEMDQEEKITGVINLGFRLRHEFFDRAIREQWRGELVIQKLEEGVFDPEFYAPYHLEIQQAFQGQFGLAISTLKQTFLQKIFGARL
ncbi:MAG: FAD-dependent oxidoreductase [Bacteroidetes bacterium]|nr:FAD-dependent oxidoreductase [Bacteroidota bacterium]MDA1268042.1 FAD-dependent oxidoreductase [Bacteroidota bacterium]